MNLPAYYKTNHAEKINAKQYQFCSIACLVGALKGKKVSDSKVVDIVSLKFIDKQKAYYDVGSSKPGTIAIISKYAFAKKEDAKAFLEKFAGKLMSSKQTFSQIKVR